MSRQPDFSTAPRPSRAPALENVAVAIGLVALILAGSAAWRAQDETGSPAFVSTRCAARWRPPRRACGPWRRARGAEGPRLAAVDAEPARSWRTSATVLPGDARLERLSIDYVRGGAVELDGGGPRRLGVGPAAGAAGAGAAVP